MKFSTPALVSLAAMFPAAASGYSLFGPSLLEPALTFSPMIRRQQARTRSFDDAFKQMSPRYEIVNNPDQLQIAMDVPGVKLEDVNVSVEDNGKLLTIRGSRAARTDSSSYTSEFSQSFSLDQVVDVDNIQAHLMDGVLTVTAPKDMKRLEEGVRSIPISASAPPVVEAPKLEAATEEHVLEEKVEAQDAEVQAAEPEDEKIEL